MNRIISSLFLLLWAVGSHSQHVMLQGFYWDSFVDTQWSNLEKQADELSEYFSLIWVPQSGNCNSDYNQMGYTPVYYFNHNSSFGTEAQLRSMISTFKGKGTGVIADVVINHRNNLGVNSSWVDYPSETYNGTTYTMPSTDICYDDDGGKTRTWASSNGYSLSANADTGEGWDGCRDLDHKSSNVNKVVKAYLSYLLNDLGYYGFRYDMVKGYSASFTADYNTTAKPQFSVGEYWDSSTKIKNWISATKVDGEPTSSAFDFQFRYRVRDAVNGNNWARLSASTDGNDGKPLIQDADYRRYAVTFVENHDTEYRSSSAQQDPLKKDTLAANAFMLAMPGTPCVFLKHWQAYKQEIKQMIAVRNIAGIHSESTYTQLLSQPFAYAAQVSGTNADLVVIVGSGTSAYKPSATDFTEVISGYHYKYYLANTANTAWADKASGEYDDPFTVNMKAVTTESATLVYRLNNDEWLTAPSSLAITDDCTLEVGLLIAGSVTGIISRQYTFAEFQPHTATIYVRNENNWSTLNFYLWDSNDNTQLNGNWPGKVITETEVVGGQTWYKQTINIPSKGYYTNAVFSTGTGSPQTVDVTQIDDDSYFIIRTGTNGSKHIVDKVDEPAEPSPMPYCPDFALGADISWYTQQTASGYTYKNHDGTVTANLPELVADYGGSVARLRIWVNPSGSYCNLADVVTKAKACHEAGLNVMIDFHLADDWCDPSKQPVPSAWSGHNITQLKTDVANHIREVLNALIEEGVTPRFVQVGNETNDGVLWEYGRASTNAANYKALIAAGYDAVKEVSPETKVIVHLSNGYDQSLYDWNLGLLDKLKFDLIGMSLYPSYSNMDYSTCINKCMANIKHLYTKFGKETMIVETGVPVATSTSPQYMAEILKKAATNADGHCRGVLYWEPEAYPGWQAYQLGAASISGKTICFNDIFDAFRKAAKGDANGDGVIDVADITAVAGMILGTTAETTKNADANGDGAIDVTDITTIAGIILGK